MKEEADSLEEAAKDYKHIIFVAEVEHYNKEDHGFFNRSVQILKILKYQKLNLGFFISDTRPWFLKDELSGGLPLDSMIHDLSLLDSTLGQRDSRNGTLK